MFRISAISSSSLVLLISFLIFGFEDINAQYFVDGSVYDEHQTPIPFAKVFVKNSPSQRTVADINGRYQISLPRGEYFLVFSSTGFETRESYLSINDKNLVKDIQIFPWENLNVLD